MIIDIPSDDGVTKVEVEEFKTLERIRKIAEAPIDKMEKPENIEMTEELVGYMKGIVISQTDISSTYLNSLNMENCIKTMSRVVTASFGIKPEPLSKSDYKYNPNEIDFNDDGSVDLDDWI